MHTLLLPKFKELVSTFFLQFKDICNNIFIFFIEHEAARLAVHQRSDSAAAAHHVAATKDATLGPLNAGHNHIQNVPLPFYGNQRYQQTTPWNTFSSSPLDVAGNEWPAFSGSYVPSVKSGGYNVWG